MIEVRPMIKFLKDKYPDNNALIGAEIGVRDCENAENIIETLNPKKLYLVDPWLFYEEYREAVHASHKFGIPNYQEEVFDKQYLYAKELEEKHKCIQIIRDTSINAAKLIPNKSLDFVYIDGNHQYEFVIEDIKSWFPKLKVGGIIGGHDFCDRHFGVVMAIVDFYRMLYKIDPIIKLHIRVPDWWIEKTL
jgi:hypothetical protein